jgi:dihydroflavonol-4-reductase
MNPHDQVLVTGGSGFIAGHCILLLLQAGYRVRTTIRSREKEAATRRVLGKGWDGPRAAPPIRRR